MIQEAISGTLPCMNEELDGAQALVKTLEDLGVDHIFGYSGGAAIPIFDALVTATDKIKLVMSRHEQGAGCCACHERSRGREHRYWLDDGSHG